jgi:hypothetical protein
MLCLYLIALLALGAAGCAALEEPFRAHEESASAEVRQCAGRQHFDDADAFEQRFRFDLR